ncbi:MAG: ABC transporter substrate-binding protein, partial [Thermoplasmata archaeon]|nr:ABC transporter substrate-binding protein [Thermoplasmata archaeon]
IEIVDSYTIVFHLIEPSVAWWLALTDNGSGLYNLIVCKKYVETVGETEAMTNPIGSGPYRLVDHKFGDSLTFEALDEHWRVVPEFKYLIIKLIPEDSTAMAMLKTGAIDISNIPSQYVAEMEESGFKVGTKPAGDDVFLMFGGMIDPHDKRYEEGYSQQDPWVDVRVREAMNIALDRQAIVDALYPGGIGVVRTLAWTLPGWEDFEPIPYDPARAKQLLVDAGYPDGFSFKVISWPKEFEIEKLMMTVAGYWEEIGLKPEIVMTDYPTYKAQNRDIGKTAGDIYSVSSYLKVDQFDSIVLRLAYDCASPAFQNEELQAFIDRFRRELDWNKRNAIWPEFDEYLYNNYIFLPIATVLNPWVYNPEKVETGVPPGMTNEPYNFAYLRHAEPLNTFRLFDLDK